MCSRFWWSVIDFTSLNGGAIKSFSIAIRNTIFTIFLEEIARNRSNVGKVELVTREGHTRAINLYRSLGFVIEGRMEMRIKTPSGGYEADIPMGWQNPNFEFD